ncbi:MAG: 4Fe-4S dicluster domain-containing protein [Gemmatimonadales bacterium]|nr:4Fe-4S dicluster domain-containing protein [Gemmatimonadales bacterium]NIN11132.1 4Fe-4S dicluster domain-containing protein [Gemmatimonadales bacterium]NIN49731.1 4Fe-4S dicluster domain-containing protein [Gemmatimonadales bacterium]NIP07195.1 4Fe-4S dicluster domain-containing protein [Gemmatimonadales bacterium]NIR00408.1 4Fe-4S dicluster domain-containing protein [Gemmatimonadales bacterium]
MLTGDLTLLNAATVGIGALILLGLTYATIASLRENEPRAAGRASVLAIVLPLPYLLVGLVNFRYQTPVAVALVLLTAAVALVLIIPVGRRPRIESGTPKQRIDERDIMFSRRLLRPGTARFEEYYAANPAKKAPDDQFRAKPGLLTKGASAYHPYAFAAADASFTTVEHLRPFVDGVPATEKVASDPAEMSAFIKRWALKLGAVSVGVTELRDYHLYSVIGRGDDYGQPVTLAHEFAIALTVEMDKGMLDRAPLGPTVMESAQQYLASGAIAVQIAEFIRRLGYPARAHIDGNYRVVCPLVARDAGLGEIGRMGLLMTPQLGPRVRIAAVTTDLPLVADGRKRDPTMIDFCTHCKKCAHVCPSRAISFEDRKIIDGVRRWQIDSESCFTLWCTIGTDCARCVAACPYSHPDSLLHNLVRRGVHNSSLFRRAAIWADDFFYGKKPPTSDLPEWMTLEPTTEPERGP